MHPSEEVLLSYVSGEADLPHRVLVEGHLDGCPECRGAVAALRAPGARWLSGQSGPPPSVALWDRLKASVEALGPPPAPDASPLAGTPIPRGAWVELAAAGYQAPRGGPHWRSLGVLGAAFAVLHRDARTGSYLLLGRSKPARFFPRHRHPGSEEILLLQGGFEDQYGHFEAGMYATYEPGTEHRPWIEEKEPCWTLSRLEKPVEFFGWRGVVQRLVT